MHSTSSDIPICACRGHCEDPPVSRNLVVLLAILLLIQIRTDTNPESGLSSWGGTRGLRILAMARSAIRAQYPNPPSDRELYTSALEGMLGRLKDPYSEFLPPEMTRFSVDLLRDQVHGGIGVFSVPAPDGGVLIQELIRNGAAEKAGLQKGDVITSVDGAELATRRPGEIMTLLRGPVNTPVSVTVRSPDGQSRTRTLIRQALPQFGSVFQKWYPEKICYLRIFIFSDGLHLRIRESVARAIAQGMQGLIIDFRLNGGGALEEGLATADLFLEKGPISIIERTRRQDQESQTLHIPQLATPGKITDVPIVILVSEQTASAAELFSAALQDHDRAWLIGEKTFGKARIQEIITLPHTRSALKLTVGFYLTPKGKNIDGAGIQPNLSLPLQPEQKRILSGFWQREWVRGEEDGIPVPPDPQLDEALKYLNQHTQRKEPPSNDTK